MSRIENLIDTWISGGAVTDQPQSRIESDLTALRWKYRIYVKQVT